MEVLRNNYVPGDPSLIDRIVCELKSQGIFDQFRKECIADVDTKPAYQNLRQRVEGSVSGFLRKQTWKPDMNKNQVREMLRKNIHESGFLETGVERIVDQVVNPKINTVFLPQVEDVFYRFLGIEKPQRTETKSLASPLKINILENLLPTDLEAISPDSDIHDDEVVAPNETEKVMENSNDNTQEDSREDLNDSKLDEDESPPFEPLEETVTLMAPEENSVDSHMSGFSGLASHDSNHSREQKVDVSNQDSQISKHSSEGQMSLSVSDDNETKMEVCEDSVCSKSSKLSSSKFEFNQDSQSNSDKSLTKEGEKRERKSSSSGKYKSSSKKDDKDKEKEKKSEKKSEDKEKKERHSNSKDSKSSSKDRKSSSSSKHESRSEKDHDKSKSKSSTSRHSSSSNKKDTHSKDSNKDKDKKSLSSKDKEHSKDSKPKDKGDGKTNSSHSSSKHSSDKHRKDDKQKHSSSSHNKDKRENKKDPKKDTKDDHFSSKHKKHDRRSKDRDSSDGQSGQKTSSNLAGSSSSTQSQKPNQESSGSNSGSADSGNSETDAAEKVTHQTADFQQIKIIKPKFASNIHEARRLMKIRKQLNRIEKGNQFSTDNSLLLIRQPKTGGNGLLETMHLEEAKKGDTEESSEENDDDDDDDDNVKTNKNKNSQRVLYNQQSEDENLDNCNYFEETATPETEKFLNYANEEIQKLEQCIESMSSPTKKSKKPLQNATKNNLKRKRNTDVKNNNKNYNNHTTEAAIDLNNSECGLVKKTRRSSAMVTVLNDNFSLPLSPAESEKSVDKKVEVQEKVKRNSLTAKATQRYSSEDLYKPRLFFSSTRRRNRNMETD